jgi:hypothetical protein
MKLWWVLVLLSSCATELCLRRWDDGYFRCMTDEEICSNYPERCSR